MLDFLKFLLWVVLVCISIPLIYFMLSMAIPFVAKIGTLIACNAWILFVGICIGALIFFIKCILD